ncbi:MAG: septum formation initiator family protein [Verrucomicrobiota bacterium]|nr:septum formation initiator family protein [Verrucomicrobiota bacterium]MEC9327252.1 septum formation initiator family protein [Verrucomicrobiota bacterium]
MGNISNRQRQHRAKREEVGLNLWQRLTRILLLASVVGVGILVFSVFAPEWEKLKDMDRENAVLMEHLDKLNRERNDRLQDELYTSNDIGYLEIVARDRLDLQLPEEVIFRIQR